MAFVNTITTNDGTVYDVQDKRLEVTSADAGKLVSVDENGNLSLVTPSAGTKWYHHVIDGEDNSGPIRIDIIAPQQNLLNNADDLARYAMQTGIYSSLIDVGYFAINITRVRGTIIDFYTTTSLLDNQHSLDLSASTTTDTVTEL